MTWFHVESIKYHSKEGTPVHSSGLGMAPHRHGNVVASCTIVAAVGRGTQKAPKSVCAGTLEPHGKGMIGVTTSHRPVVSNKTRKQK